MGRVISDNTTNEAIRRPDDFIDGADL